MWITLHGANQYYEESGNKSGIPVLFIHGFPFESSFWEKQVEAMPDKYRVITYDVRGHGKSEPGTFPYNMDFFVDDLFSLIEKLELRQPIVCGLSMGGYIALRAFERWPAMFKALVLCDTRSEADSNAAKINRANAIRTIQNEGVQKYARDSVNNLFAEQSVSNNIPAINHIRNIIEQTLPTVIESALMALAARTDTTEILCEINIPTLIIVGEHDKITPPIAAELLHENIHGSELVIIKNAGHLSNLENPDEFNNALLSFLEKME